MYHVKLIWNDICVCLFLYFLNFSISVQEEIGKRKNGICGRCFCSEGGTWFCRSDCFYSSPSLTPHQNVLPTKANPFFRSGQLLEIKRHILKYLQMKCGVLAGSLWCNIFMWICSVGAEESQTIFIFRKLRAGNPFFWSSTSCALRCRQLCRAVFVKICDDHADQNQ